MITERGTFMIAGHEALVPGRYLDKVNIPTCYIGHTKAAGTPDPMTIPLAMPQTQEKLDEEIKFGFELFERDLGQYSRAVQAHFGKMRPHEHDGWTSWHFNTGGAFTSSAASHWKAGRKARAVSIMKQWNKVTVGGKKVVSKALAHRRQEEADLILRGVYPKRDVPVFYTDGRGNVNWKPVEVLDFAEVKRLAFDAQPETFFDRLWNALKWRRWFS